MKAANTKPKENSFHHSGVGIIFLFLVAKLMWEEKVRPIDEVERIWNIANHRKFPLHDIEKRMCLEIIGLDADSTEADVNKMCSTKAGFTDMSLRDKLNPRQFHGAEEFAKATYAFNRYNEACDALKNRMKEDKVWESFKREFAEYTKITTHNFE